MKDNNSHSYMAPVCVCWETIPTYNSLYDTKGTILRSPVPGGWIVKDNGGICYYPDKEHVWFKDVQNGGGD